MMFKRNLTVWFFGLALAAISHGAENRTGTPPANRVLWYSSPANFRKPFMTSAWIPAGKGIGFEIKINDATTNASKPILDRLVIQSNTGDTP